MILPYTRTVRDKLPVEYQRTGYCLHRAVFRSSLCEWIGTARIQLERF
jgi:hypothetical protein